jgi:hypothetical protein
MRSHDVKQLVKLWNQIPQELLQLGADKGWRKIQEDYNDY